MTLTSWFANSVGRVREGTKKHLVDTLRLLQGDSEVIQTMRIVDDEECERLFLESISKTNGSAVDFRAKSFEVIEVLTQFLRIEEIENIEKQKQLISTRPAEIAKELNTIIGNDYGSIRALDSFGDSVIVLYVSREQLPRFDEINRYWLL
jgi:hypothetical protein